MNDYLVEILIDTGWENVINKEQLDKLQMVSSKPINAQQLSKRHMDKQYHYLWDEDREHEDAKIMVDAYYVGGLTVIVPLKCLLDKDIPIKFHIKNRIKEIPERAIEADLIDSLTQIEKRLSVFDALSEYNFKVGVHISDLGLLNVRYVTYIVDSCTDDLQGYLDEGWRILAVCPQPDSRRPDYILGRNNKVD